MDTDRFTNHRQSYFDRAWKRVEVQVNGFPATLNPPRPARLDEMLKAAERIGADYDFVRVDLYDLPDGLKFGEMTFAPHSGFAPFRPRRFDFIFGTLWDEAKAARRSGGLSDERVNALLHGVAGSPGPLASDAVLQAR